MKCLAYMGRRRRFKGSSRLAEPMLAAALAVSLIGLGRHSVWAAAGPACHPERILVMPRAGLPPERLRAFHAAHGRRVLRAYPRLGGLEVVRVRPDVVSGSSQKLRGERVEEALASYRASGLVAWAEPDYVARATGVLPNDPYFQNGTQWWLNNYGQNGGVPDADLDAPEAWDVRRSAGAVVVAIIDSGVRSTHEDLAANLWRNPQDGTPGFNALTGRNNPWDDNGHGTHLAGIIGALTDNGRGVAGLAWQVQLMACKFLDAAGDGYYSDAIACIEFARSHGAHILNLSWTGTEFSASLSNALWAAAADGLMIVAAAGNDAANLDWSPVYPACFAVSNLVAVGASTRADEVWPSSNYGATRVHLFAPGAVIYSTTSSSDTAYQSRNGTSMATAMASGALALLRQQYPQAPASALITHLLWAVDRRSAFAGKCRSGGRLNLRKALDRPGLALSPQATGWQVRVSGPPSHGYVLSASSNLTVWTRLRTNTTGPEGYWLLEEVPAAGQPQRFYCAEPAP